MIRRGCVEQEGGRPEEGEDPSAKKDIMGSEANDKKKIRDGQSIGEQWQTNDGAKLIQTE